MRTRLALAAGTAALALAGSVMAAAPALAGTSGDTGVTFTLTGAGGLQISVPATAAVSSSMATNAGPVTKQFGNVQVTDSRGTLLGSWTATALSSDFSTTVGGSTYTIPATAVTYFSAAATAFTGVVTAVPGQANAAAAVAIDTAQTAMSGTVLTGNNSVTWQPTVAIALPSDAVAGDYSGTVTHSVA